MSEMDVSEGGNDCSNDLLLLDRVFLRLGNADTDEQLENCLSRFLAPVILKLSSPHEKVRTKVMELLVHVNKRVKCTAGVQLPVQTLLQNYMDPKANSFITNFSIIYITMGFPRLPKDQQLAIAPTLVEAIENKPQGHQDGVLMLLMPLLGDLKLEKKQLEAKPKLYYRLLVKFAYYILLLPYRALPSNPAEREEFQVPPGLSMKIYKRIVDKHVISPTQLEEMKLSIVNFISQDCMDEKEMLAPLIVAAADSRFSVANSANSPLIRVANSVDWSSLKVVVPLYSLYLGSLTLFGKTAPDDKVVPACTRLRLKIIQYLSRATGEGIMFPHCFQVVFYSLFDANPNARLRNLALSFLLHILQNAKDSSEDPQFEKMGSAILHGLLKVIDCEDFSEHHAKAFTCLGRLAIKNPTCINSQLTLFEKFVKKISDAPPELKTAIRDALLEMAVAYKISSKVTEDKNAMDTSGTEPSAGTSAEPMDVDTGDTTQLNKKPKIDDQLEEPQTLALLALLDQYIQSEDNMIRYVGMRYAAAVFPSHYIPSRYLLLLAAGDSQDEISNEAKKCLYGSFRASEIEDVVNNVSDKQSNVVKMEDDSDKNKETSEGVKVPKFGDMVNYIWEQIQKRKTGSNLKHRFVISNQVLQFHPNTYNEMLRYLRMCLNHEADLKDCSNHPNGTSPILAKYIVNHLMGTDVLDKYLTMITNVLNASPDLMPLTCFLDIVGCVPQKIAANYTNLLPFLKNLFITSSKEEIRDTSAVIYAIIFVHTKDKAAIDKEISEFVGESVSNKSLESQCGFASASAQMCEVCIHLSKTTKQFGGKGFNPINWTPYKDGAVCWGNMLSNPQSMLISTGCKNIALLARTTALPLPKCTDEEEKKLTTDNPFDIGKPTTDNDKSKSDGLTKFSVVDRLFKIVHNVKLSSKIKEKAVHTLGILCCGEKFPFAKQIIGAFLLMAKETKEFEIHLQIGEALVLCVEGVNSNENRNMWTQLPLQGKEKIRDSAALAENNELLEWLLSELFKLGKVPHPHSRQATSIWLLAILKNCADREPIMNKLQELQDMFMDLLSENNDIVQDVSSKGLSLVYQSSDEVGRRDLVGQIIEQLTSGRRAVTHVTDDTKLFEEGQLGKAPTGGNLSTYKELCSLASDLNQPDLLYKFMHLAHHNSIWNSKKGAAFGFHSIALQAGAQLSEHLPKIVPRLYRYRFDPTPRIQNSMASIWHALVPETQKTVQKYHKQILDDLVTNLTSNQWRVRMSCCNALSDLLRGAQSLHDSIEQLPTIWKQLFRVMDDVHEGTRLAATSTANVLSKLCIRASESNQGKDGAAVVAAILPVLLDVGITNLVRDVRNVSLTTVSKLVECGGAQAVSGWVSVLVPALVSAAGELESSRLSHLSAALANDAHTQLALDDARATHAGRHRTAGTVLQCMPHINMETMTEMLPKMLELTKSPQLGTKVACCNFFVLAAKYLRQEIEPISGKIMVHLLNGAMDRNAAVRKVYAEALGQVAAYAKSSSIEKLMKKLLTLNETKGDDTTRSVIALILKAVAKAKLENLKDHETIIAPLVFLAKHGNKDEEEATVEMFEDIWMDISPSPEAGIRENLVPICRYLEEALNSRSWDKKIQASRAVQTLVAVLPAGGDRESMARALLAAAHGKTFPGKYHVLQALADVCVTKEGNAALNGPLAEEVCETLLSECRKSEPAHRRRALRALSTALAALPPARFRHVHDIVTHVLHQDEAAIAKDSDEEDNEGANQRRADLIALKEAAYELLGNAWPSDPGTQEEYALELVEHCAGAIRRCGPHTQLAILSALERVLPRALHALAPHAHYPLVLGHAAGLLDYVLQNVNQVRHRRETLSLLEILVKKLIELNDTENLNKLKEIFQTHVTALSRDPSHEIRTKTDALKELFK